ncbi:MAG: DUF177 domain-containing protein [Candidatus Omnitrophota bacterium]
MRVNVDNIPEEGLILNEDMSVGIIAPDLKDQGIVFSKSIKVEAKITRLQSEVLVDVNLEAPCEFTCARCLAKIENNFKKSFNVNYEVKPGDILELGEDIRQEIILDSPIKILCKDDCKGLCKNCGQNLNICKCECK